MIGGSDFYFDECVLGAAKILRREFSFDVLHPGHPSVPDLPLGAPDTAWMQVVAGRELIAVTRDLRLKRRSSERIVWREHGLRVVLLGSREDLRPRDEVDIFLKHLDRIRRYAVKAGRGPWGLSVTRASARPLKVT